jgi:hypothetical protein
VHVCAQASADLERLQRASAGAGAPEQALAALSARARDTDAKHADAVSKLAAAQGAQEAAEKARARAEADAAAHQQTARTAAIRCARLFWPTRLFACSLEVQH